MHHLGLHMSHAMRKPDLCLRYTDSTIPLLHKSEISSFSLFQRLYRPVCVGPVRKPRRPVFSRCGSYVAISEGRGSGFENEKVLIQEIQCLIVSPFHSGGP